jgi:hypothetical protein
MSQIITVTIDLKTYEDLKSKADSLEKNLIRISGDIKTDKYYYYTQDEMIFLLKEDMQKQIDFLNGHNIYLTNRIEELKEENELFKKSKKEEKKAYFDSIKKLLTRK